MGCVCPSGERKDDNYKVPNEEDQATTLGGRNSMLSKKPKDEEVAIKKRILHMDEVNWH